MEKYQRISSPSDHLLWEEKRNNVWRENILKCGGFFESCPVLPCRGTSFAACDGPRHPPRSLVRVKGEGEGAVDPLKSQAGPLVRDPGSGKLAEPTWYVWAVKKGGSREGGCM